MNAHTPARIAAVFGVVLALISSSCTTTSYDYYGNPRPTVDPTLAIAGIAAAGVLGYALADGHRGHRHHYRGHSSHRGHRGYHGRGGHCW